jgi:soluble lytic murein transglycosylase-like protein
MVMSDVAARARSFDETRERFPGGMQARHACTFAAWAAPLAAAALCCAPMRAHAVDCFDAAASYQHVNPMVLRAIAWQESHNRADAKHVNANGSIDYGVMQINTIHLPALARYGIDRDALMSPCKNIYIAAWQLRKQVVKYGNTWAAVGAYHSATPALRDQYAQQIAAILRRWGVLPATTRSVADNGVRRASIGTMD